MTEAVPQRLLTRTEAAAFLGVSPKTLDCWAWRRRGPKFVKVGRLARYRVQDLNAYVEANAREGEPARVRAMGGVR